MNSIRQDPLGNFWFATSNGITRYDGNWRTFTAVDGLAGNSVTSIFFDHTGGVWTLSDGARLSHYDGFAWKAFTTADGLLSDRVNYVLEDRRGDLWFTCGTDAQGRPGGLGRYTPSTSRWVNFDDIFAAKILEDRAGNLWFETSAGAMRYDPFLSDWTTFDVAGPILEDPSGYLWFYRDINRRSMARYDPTTSGWSYFDINYRFGEYKLMAVDRDGDLWFVRIDNFDGYLERYHPTTSTWIGYGDVGDPKYLIAALQDRQGNMWFVGNAGAYRYDGSRWRAFGGGGNAIDLPAGNSVLCISQDADGNLWFGMLNGGVGRFDGSSWEAPKMNPEGDSQDVPVVSLCEDDSGGIWAGARYYGAYRYDGSSWLHLPYYPTSDSVSSFYGAYHIAKDRSGAIWIAGGSSGPGVIRYDGSTSRTFTTADGLASDYVSYSFEDRAGNLWFGAADPLFSPATGGLTRYDRRTSSWRVFTIADGLPGDFFTTIAEDRDGYIWVGVAAPFGYARGAARYDPSTSTWRTFTTADGLPSLAVHHILKDRVGNLWFGTNSGAARYDGSTWQTFTVADGLADEVVNQIFQDRTGNLWFATNGGVTRYDGSTWRSFTSADGLKNNYVTSILEDRAGNFWFGTYFGHPGGVNRYVPDRVPPHTAFLIRPPRLTSSRSLVAVFTVLGESDGIEYSARLDGGAWSGWSSNTNWTGSGLADGSHMLEVRSRDYLCNVDSTVAVAIVDVDATPPAPIIASPTFGQPVRGTLEIRGVAVDARFESYRVDTRPVGATSWDPPQATILAESSIPVSNGSLASWNTSSLADGSYELRLSVSDSLGLTGIVQAVVVVDNHAPYAEVTAPAKVPAASGGDIFTTNSELHLYFPPHAFQEDALVMITRAASASDTLPSGAVQVLPAYDVSWSPSPLRKPATLEFSTAGFSGALDVYFFSGDAWEHLGGSQEDGRVSLTIQNSGRYALFERSSSVEGSPTLSALTFTPRVFSATNRFANDHVAIGFTLGRSGPVMVRIYNRAGRLVREVIEGQVMNAGANLVRWDGTDRAGIQVADGIYLVTVEALGETRKSALAVVK